MSVFLSGVLDVAILVFSVTSMVTVGVGNTIRQVIGPLRNVGAVLRALAANFLLVPLVAFAVTRVIALDRPLEIGLLPVASSAGAPFLIKLVEVAEGRLGLSASLLVILLPATVIYAPIVVPLLVPEATVQTSAIAWPLLLTMLLPLAIGLGIRAGWSRLASRMQPITQIVSTVSLIVVVMATVAGNFRAIVELLSGAAIPSALFVIVAAFGIGYALGGSDPDARAVLGLGTTSATSRRQQ
jgi:predicted Na+-dependent transporter